MYFDPVEMAFELDKIRQRSLNQEATIAKYAARLEKLEAEMAIILGDVEAVPDEPAPADPGKTGSASELTEPAIDQEPAPAPLPVEPVTTIGDDDVPWDDEPAKPLADKSTTKSTKAK